MGTNLYAARNFNEAGGATRWGAIFGGTFVYIAVMSTFGLMLSSAIFSSSGWTSLGFVIWNSVVAIISLYIAGRATGHLAALTDRNIGMWHGLVTFGMCFFATVLVLGIAMLGAAPYSGAAARNSNVASNIIGVAGAGGWALWCAMILGFIGAAMGGSQAASQNVSGTPGIPTTEQPEIRRVA